MEQREIDELAIILEELKKNHKEISNIFPQAVIFDRLGKTIQSFHDYLMAKWKPRLSNQLKQEYAKVIVTLPPITFQRINMFSLFQDSKVTVEGKELPVLDFEFKTGSGKPELILCLPGGSFEIKVEPDTADDLINEIESAVKEEKNDSSKV